MRSSVVNSSAVQGGVAFAVLLAIALAMQPVERLVLASGSAGRLHRDQLIASAGHGSTLALLGGMRSMVASGFAISGGSFF